MAEDKGERGKGGDSGSGRHSALAKLIENNTLNSTKKSHLAAVHDGSFRR